MSIEPLETRIAPATLVSPTTVTFQDLDGDDVTVKFSKPILDSLATANAVLLSTGDVVAANGNTTGQQLQLIDLSGQLGADGIGFSVTAKSNAVRGGDGFADVGRIDATGLDLGAVSIAGDLGVIDAGNPNVAGSAVKSLTVQSIGELGLSTGAPDLVSNFDGRVDKLTVKGHVREARVVVVDSVITDVAAGTDREASIGTLVIGGSVIGGAAQNSGSIEVNDRLDSVKIAGDIRGGAGSLSGKLTAVRSMGAVSIGGSIVGAGPSSGMLVTTFGIVDSLSIGGDIRGGAGTFSGTVDIDDDGDRPMKFFKLGGSLVGGAAATSGRVSIDAPVGAFFIGGDVRGGGLDNSGQITLGGAAVKSITIGGSLRAEAGDFAAQLIATFADVGTLKIGGSLDGTGSDFGAQIKAASVKSLTVGGSLVGGGTSSGLIEVGDLGSAKIGGSLLGGAGENSGRLQSFGAIRSVTVGGSLVGGDGEGSGRIRVTDELFKAVIAGDLRGGAGEESGAILSSDRLAKITINGSVYSGTGLRSGSVASGDDIVSLTIKGSLIGLPNQPATIAAEDNQDATATSHVVLGKITIGGRVENGLILAGYDFITPTTGDAQIGSITVGGDWIASSIAAGVDDGADNRFGTADDQAIAAGNTLGIASRIGSVKIKGQALGSVAGGDNFGIVAEEIGSIKIGAVSETLIAGEVDAVPLGAAFDFIAREDVVGATEILVPNLAGAPDSTTVTIVSPKLATWIDVDGDVVTLKTTKPILSIDNFTFVTSGAGIQVQQISLADDDPALAKGTGITITAKAQDVNDDGILDGDGSVNIGHLDAAGIDLGAVKIAGDLARIDAGDSGSDAAFATPGLKSLTVQSMGAFGLTTQAAGGDLSSTIIGQLGALTIRGDADRVVFGVLGLAGGFGADEGGIGKLKIGGSLRGGDVQSESGQITASGKIGAVTIGGTLFGGAAPGSATVRSQSSIGAVKIGGSIIGGAGNVSGQIQADGGIASATIGRDMRGGGGEASGTLDGGVKIGAVKIGGTVIGGAGEESGSLLAETFGGEIGAVKIGGDVRGGDGEESAYIHAETKLGFVTIAGSLVGGGGDRSAFLYAGSANALPHIMAGVQIGGDMIGGAGGASAFIGSAFGVGGSTSDLEIGKIAIKGSMIGNALQSASITANNIKSFTLGGSMLGAASSSAVVSATGLLSSAKVGGSVIGSASTSGYLQAQALGTLSIAHDLRGGAGNFSGHVFVNLDGAKSITIGGSIESGAGTQAGAVAVNSPLGSLTIKGSVWGTAADPALILARGTDMQAKPLTLGKLTIGGSAEFLDVLGGFLSEMQPLNSDANLGKITVGGTWRAGDIVAGIKPGPDGDYGTNDDQPGTFGNDGEVFSKIAFITIKGRVLGTVGGTDDYGFTAQEIGAVKVGAVKFDLNAGAGNDNENLPADEAARLKVSSTGDVRIREIPIAF